MQNKTFTVFFYLYTVPENKIFIHYKIAFITKIICCTQVKRIKHIYEMHIKWFQLKICEKSRTKQKLCKRSSSYYLNETRCTPIFETSQHPDNRWVGKEKYEKTFLDKLTFIEYRSENCTYETQKVFYRILWHWNS